jgi:hypothetical protein
VGGQFSTGEDPSRPAKAPWMPVGLNVIAVEVAQATNEAERLDSLNDDLMVAGVRIANLLG